MKLKFKKKIPAVLMALSLCLCSACTPSASKPDGNDPGGNEPEIPPDPPEVLYDDDRTISDHAFAASQISGTDALGRSIKAGDAVNDGRDVGLFYFLWLGQHPAEQKGVYDISKFEQECEWEILDPYSEVSPSKQYHHWGEPLYGYYNSADPWVLTRHVELFTAAGIDFLMFDTTNAVIYENVVSKLLEILEKYRLQGFAVPKVAFMTNTDSKTTATLIYNNFYAPGAPYRYPELWYRPNGKPLIISDNSLYNAATGDATEKAMINLFEIRSAQWPDNPPKDENFPWMSWAYPQRNHNGVINVSVAQHTTARMSMKERNRGRGWSPDDRKNNSQRAVQGSNFQSQWDTVFSLNSNDDDADDVNTVFITGWNEWIALKMNQVGDVFFVDQYNAEYSRDLEMDNTAYGDNYYMQLVDNVHRLKYGDHKHYKHTQVTLSSASDEGWGNVRAYPDFVGDAMARNYAGYAAGLQYTDNTNRHDIAEVKVASDAENVYFRIECAANLANYAAGDTTYMNIWLTTKRETGYEYVINRTFGKLTRINADGSYADVCDVAVSISGKVMTVTVPLQKLGVNAQDPGFMFKVSDGVDASNVMNFYIQGDSAPLGRLSYTYGFVK